MNVNSLFEKSVRIQTEPGHRVIQTGPDAWVRHPGDLGFISWMLATPLLLGSAWAPSALSILALLVRTVWEDRTLRSELPGDEAYTMQVSYQCVP